MSECLSGIRFLKQKLFKMFSLHTCTYNLGNVQTLLKLSCILIFCCGMVWYSIFLLAV